MLSKHSLTTQRAIKETGFRQGFSKKARLLKATPRRMWSIQSLRFQRSIDHFIDTLLDDDSLDARLMPASSARDSRAIRSSASTPSLRSKDGSVPVHARMDGGSSVRVVVRVRAFLRRGEQTPVQSPLRA